MRRDHREAAEDAIPQPQIPQHSPATWKLLSARRIRSDERDFALWSRGARATTSQPRPDLSFWASALSERVARVSTWNKPAKRQRRPDGPVPDDGKNSVWPTGATMSAHEDFSLGLKYRRGEGVPQDHARAAALFLKAADQGSLGGEAILGLVYELGQGVPQDYIEASRWYRRAAERGNDDAQFSLGELFLNGRGVPLDHSEALRWFLRAAGQGNPDAEFQVGCMFRDGSGIPKDDPRAADWFRKAADQGNAGAQFNLGLMSKEGVGLRQDDQEAIAWFLKAAKQGHADAQYELSMAYRFRRDVPPDYAEAAAWLRKAAEQGDAEAQMQLGNEYHNGYDHGRGGPPQDYVAASAWYRKAADQGHAEAQEFLGRMYQSGLGVPEDMAQAIAWYRKAADQEWRSAQDRLAVLYAAGIESLSEDPRAAEFLRNLADPGANAYRQFDLGQMYYRGIQVPEDLQEAATWFYRAANQGHGHACHWLGLMYENGQGVPQDAAEAAKWYRQYEGSLLAKVDRLKEGHDAPAMPHEAQEGVDQSGEDTDGGRRVTRSQSGTRRGLDKVAGMRGLKALLRREVVDYVRNPERHRRYGLSLPNGILLYGPPGCGKTYISRLLAEELGHHFVEITPGDVASPYIHDTVKQIRTAFDSAAAQAPAVMFIDEFEAFVPPRGELGGFQQYKAEEVNEFLALLNGCSEKRILVIAATNLPQNIDPAVRRTGRLDKLIYVGPPDLEARREMLALHLGTRPVSADLDLSSLAEKLDGYSASDIKFLVDQAARHAMEEEADIAPDSFRFAMVGITPSVPPEVADQYRSIGQRGN